MAEKSSFQQGTDPTGVNFVNNQPPPPPYSGGPAPGPSGVTYVASPGVVVTPVTTVTTVAVVPGMGSSPSSFVCKSCNMQIMTRTQAKAATKTHLFALLLCVLGLWPCVCIPYCVDSCQNVDHYCPNCNAYIGTSR